MGVSASTTIFNRQLAKVFFGLLILTGVEIGSSKKKFIVEQMNFSLIL